MFNKRIEILGARKSGEEFPVELAISPIQSQGTTLFSAFIRDISERKKSAEALFQSEKNLREAQQIAKLGNFEFNIETRKVRWSEEVYNIFGVDSKKEVSLEIYQALLAEEEFAKVMVAVSHAVENQCEYRVEHKITLKNGTKKEVMSIGTPILNDAGKVVRIFGIVQDITERKRANEALQASEALLKMQIERMPIGHIIWSPDFKVQSWNPSAEEIFGFTEEEIMGQHPYGNIVPAEAETIVDAVWQRLIEGDTTAHSTNLNITKDGRTIFCEWANTPLRNKEGKVFAVLSMINDATERTLAEQRLQTSEERLNLAFLGAGDGMWDWDMVTNTVYYSPKWELMFGYEVGTAPQTLETVSQRAHPDDLEEMLTEVNRYLSRETSSYSYEFRMRHLDGTALWTLHRAVALFDDTGKAIRMIGTTTDITSRKNSEQELIFQKTLLESTSEASIDGILITDSNMKLLKSNKRFRDIWGFTEKEFYNMTSSTMIERIARLTRNYEEYMQMVKEVHTDLRSTRLNEIYLADGRIIDRYVAPIMGEEGTFYGRVLHFRDITERKRSEQQLQSNEQKLKRAQNVAKIGSWSFENSINKLDWSEETYHIFNLPVGEEINFMKFKSMIHHEDQGLYEKAWNEALNGKGLDLTHRIVAHGNVKYLRQQAEFEFDTDGNLIQCIGTFQDITQQYEAEEALRLAKDNAEE
ncbi:MAG: PAS domain S-box protein, partial [Cyclobacteriaceae bacterium]